MQWSFLFWLLFLLTSIRRFVFVDVYETSEIIFGQLSLPEVPNHRNTELYATRDSSSDKPFYGSWHPIYFLLVRV